MTIQAQNSAFKREPGPKPIPRRRRQTTPPLAELENVRLRAVLAAIKEMVGGSVGARPWIKEMTERDLRVLLIQECAIPNGATYLIGSGGAHKSPGGAKKAVKDYVQEDIIPWMVANGILECRSEQLVVGTNRHYRLSREALNEWRSAPKGRRAPIELTRQAPRKGFTVVIRNELLKERLLQALAA